MTWKNPYPYENATMKIGYPCINNSISRNSPSTFRLASYSEHKLAQIIEGNLIHLNQILKYNVKNNLLFFRISSDLIPFASHPICELNWCKHFQTEFVQIGDFIKKHNIRISMHPDQFVILNSPNSKIVENSINELKYHCRVLDEMGLDATAKVQIHVGGVYRNKVEAIDRFTRIFNDSRRLIDNAIKRRLVIENDDHLYSLKDCLSINQQTDIPIVFDSFHHQLFNSQEPLRIALQEAMLTWNRSKDGFPIVDYSSQNTGNDKEKKSRKGKHAERIELTLFKEFLEETQNLDFDIMLELKDKEKSALKALEVLRGQINIVSTTVDSEY
jgi:UV DNA damage endonuclease